MKNINIIYSICIYLYEVQIRKDNNKVEYIQKQFKLIHFQLAIYNII